MVAAGGAAAPLLLFLLITPLFRPLQNNNPPVKQVGVGVHGDACKLALDFGVTLAGGLELSGEANRRALSSLAHVTSDVEVRLAWGLADLVAQARGAAGGRPLTAL